MQFDQRTEGRYRICAGAREAHQGEGYIAAVVVNRVGTELYPCREAYRDESLACGHRFETPDDALQFAVARARQVIANESTRLLC